MNLKHCILLAARYTGLFALSRRLTSRKIRILAYHGIWLGDGHFGNFLYMDRHCFARRMELLRRWNYPVIPLQSLKEHRAKPPNAATVITIDDGWYGTYKHMVPVLETHGFPATIYLTTYYCQNNKPVVNVALQYCLSATGSKEPPALLHLPSRFMDPMPLATPAERNQALERLLDKAADLATDQDRQALLAEAAEAMGVDLARMEAERWFHLMTPEEVADASRRGISFELHTHRHRIDHAGGSCLTDEIRTNRDFILAFTGQTAQHFCYPSGVYRPEVWPELHDCEVLTATTTDIGLIDEDSELYALPRILDGQDISELEFEAEMSGFLELLRGLRRLFQ